MKLDNEKQRGVLAICLISIAFYWFLQNFSFFWGMLGKLIGMFSPFILGGAMAFVFNVPMSRIEPHLFRNSGPKGKKARRPVAYLITLLCVLGVITIVGFIVVPGVGEAISSLTVQIPAALQGAENFFNSLTERFPELAGLTQEWQIDWNKISQNLTTVLQKSGDLLNTGAGMVGNIISGISTFVIGFISSIYLLMQKEKLGQQGKKCMYALLPRPVVEKTLEILRFSVRVFSNFLSGQCLEAVILGTMFVVSMLLLRMPYALLVGVLIAMMALIPMVGAFIGCLTGFLLILTVSPLKAVLFVAMFLVLQQIEGNLIYPRVVGSSVGLPALWVLVAITVGGSLFGIVGMLVFIPLCSVLYSLFRNFINRRLEKRGIPSELITGEPPAEKPAAAAPQQGREQP